MGNGYPSQGRKKLARERMDKQWRVTHLQNLACVVRSSWSVQQKVDHKA